MPVLTGRLTANTNENDVLCRSAQATVYLATAPKSVLSGQEDLAAVGNLTTLSLSSCYG